MDQVMDNHGSQNLVPEFVPQSMAADHERLFD